MTSCWIILFFSTALNFYLEKNVWLKLEEGNLNFYNSKYMLISDLHINLSEEWFERLFKVKWIDSGEVIEIPPSEWWSAVAREVLERASGHSVFAR